MSMFLGTVVSGELWYCNTCGEGFAISKTEEKCLQCGANLSRVLMDGQKERRRLRAEIEQLNATVRQRDDKLRVLENALREARKELGELPDYMQPLEGQLALNISCEGGGESGG